MNDVDQETGEVLGGRPRASFAALAGPELYAAIVKAQGAARAVARDSKNQHHGYRYASAESVIEEAREALGAAGLALVTLGWSLAGDRDGEAVGRVFVEYRLLHATGQSLDLHSSTPVIPSKGRPADKAELGALTANLAYMLRGLLLLPRDADDSVDARDDREYRGRGERSEQSSQRRDDPPRSRQQEEREDFPPRERESDPPAKSPKQHTRELVDAYVESFKKFEADFGFADSKDRLAIFRELEQIPQKLLDLEGISDEELQRARDVYNPIARAMRATLGIEKGRQS